MNIKHLSILMLVFVILQIFVILYAINSIIKERQNNSNITTTITKPIERIIEVKNNYIIKKEYVNRPNVPTINGVSKEKYLLDRLESATPNIKSNDIIITQFEDGSISASPTVSGTIEVDYLKYSFENSVKLNVLRIKDQNNIHAISILKFNDNKIQTDIGIGTTLDFWNKNITIGIETGGMSCGLGMKVTKNSALNFGGVYNWDANVSPYVGISFKL